MFWRNLTFFFSITFTTKLDSPNIMGKWISSLFRRKTTNIQWQIISLFYQPSHITIVLSNLFIAVSISQVNDTWFTGLLPLHKWSYSPNNLDGRHLIMLLMKPRSFTFLLKFCWTIIRIIFSIYSPLYQDMIHFTYLSRMISHIIQSHF